MVIEQECYISLLRLQVLVETLGALESRNECGGGCPDVVFWSGHRLLFSGKGWCWRKEGRRGWRKRWLEHRVIHLCWDGQIWLGVRRAIVARIVATGDTVFILFLFFFFLLRSPFFSTPKEGRKTLRGCELLRKAYGDCRQPSKDWTVGGSSDRDVDNRWFLLFREGVHTFWGNEGGLILHNVVDVRS